MITSIMPEGRQRYFNNDGTPASGCLLYTYAAGTTTPKATYSDSAGVTPNSNPVVLDAKGEAVIYWAGSYKVDLKTAAGVQVTGYPVDNINTDPAGIFGILTSLAASAGAALIGFVQSAVGAIARTIQDELREEIKSTQFDTLQNAVTASAGKRLRIVGNQTVNSEIVIPSNALIIQDPGVVITLNVADIGFKIPAGASNITLKGLRITGTSSRPIGTPLNSGVSSIRIEKCDISGATLVGSGYTSGIFFDGATDVWVTGNVLHNNGLGVSTAIANCDIMFFIAQNTRCHINRNSCTSTLVGCHISTYDIDHSDISKNDCKGAVTGSSNNNGYGILVYDNSSYSPPYLSTTGYNRIEGNSVTHTGGSGIYIATSSNNTVTGNICSNNGLTQSDVTLPVGGISLNGPQCTNNTITGNMVDSSGKDGIVISATSQTTLSNNSATACLGNAYQLRGNGSLLTVTGNVGTSSAIGLYSDATLKNYCVISGNAFNSNGNQGLEALNMTLSALNGNVCCGNQKQGFVLTGSHNTANGNTILDNGTLVPNGYDGMNVNSDHSNFCGNRSGNQSGIDQRYGIYNTGGYCVIHDNNVIGNQTDGVFNSNAQTSTRGNKFSVGISQGTATLVGGTITINTVEARTNSLVFYNRRAIGGAVGHLSFSVVDGTSITFSSASVTDTSTVDWMIVQ